MCNCYTFLVYCFSLKHPWLMKSILSSRIETQYTFIYKKRRTERHVRTCMHINKPWMMTSRFNRQSWSVMSINRLRCSQKTAYPAMTTLYYYPSMLYHMADSVTDYFVWTVPSEAQRGDLSSDWLALELFCTAESHWLDAASQQPSWFEVWLFVAQRIGCSL